MAEWYTRTLEVRMSQDVEVQVLSSPLRTDFSQSLVRFKGITLRNPAHRITKGRLAQLVERRIYTANVASSILAPPTLLPIPATFKNCPWVYAF